MWSRKSEVRSFTRTPRAASPSSRTRRATVSAARWSQGRIAASPVTSVSRVFSEPMLLASRSGTTARASRPSASACTCPPRLAPSQRSSTSRGVAATSPMVVTLRASRRFRVRGPTPHSRSIGSGCRKRVTSPGATTVSPSGLPRSLATFATYLVVETPTETVSPVASNTARRTDPPIARGSPESASHPVMSTNASSTLRGSTSGENAPRVRITTRETARYRSKRGGSTIACGQRRRAIAIGIALPTP